MRNSIPTLPGIESRMVATPRLRQHVLLSGPADGAPVLFIHGNASSAIYWEETMLALPASVQSPWTCAATVIRRPAEFNQAFHALLKGV